jgi:hypothetical protein
MNNLVQAANILNTGEYQVLQQAYLNWHGACAGEGELIILFSYYMQYGDLPHWADNFAKSVISDFNAEIDVNPGFYSLSSFCPRVGSAKKIPTFSID